MKPQEKIIVYGTNWCPDNHRARLILNKNNIDYIYINIDEDKEALSKVIEINAGKRIIPTILFPDGSVLTEPSNKVLREKISGLA